MDYRLCQPNTATDWTRLICQVAIKSRQQTDWKDLLRLGKTLLASTGIYFQYVANITTLIPYRSNYTVPHSTNPSRGAFCSTLDGYCRCKKYKVESLT